MASLKRRHEDSSYAQLSEYSLRKESGSRNVHSLSTDTTNNYTDDDRVHSPNSVMDAHSVFNPPRESKRTLSFAKRERSDSYAEDNNDPEAEKRVTIWNWREQRKLSGNSAPFKKNLKDYIRKHPDWEQYVGQDKDALTGKKLSAKKMKAPAPQDPEHPWYTNGGVMPPSPSARETPHTSSYGTRSTQSRLHESEGRTQESRPARVPEPERPVINIELSQPFSIILEDPATVLKRRAAEVAARRESMAAEATSAEDSSEPTAEDELEASLQEEATRSAEWAAATEKVAAERAEKAAAEEKAAEEALTLRRNAHSEVQGGVVNSAMARIEAFRKKRRMLVA